MIEKYVNPFTDFGFKKIFGDEQNKDLLIDFLNEVLQEKSRIIDLTFLKNEQLGVSQSDRKAVFDLYCQNEKGEKFIVELQKAKQEFFKDRSLYYATFALQEQAVPGDWDFKLNAVYSVSIMDFVFDEHSENKDKLRHDVKLIEVETGKVFNPKLRFIYLEMPKFNKTEDELETNYDKWLYLLKNLARLQNASPKLQERVFKKAFEIAEIANYTREEFRNYQDSVKYYRDLKNVVDTAIKEGTAQGIAKGIAEGKTEKTLEIALKMKKLNVEIETIITATGLSREEIEKL
jgi:predicted transposase/invertase (TIGR01784 family)